MPLTKLQFKPGVNRDQTNYSSEGGWYQSQLVRFRNGFPEKMGGWTVSNYTQYDSTAISIYPYGTQDGQYTLLGLATNTKNYIVQGTNLIDITPIRITFNTPDTDNCFATTDTSTTVVVTITGHGALDGDFVTFSGATAVGGVPAGDLNINHKITYIDANSFSITVATAATSTVASGGGTAITAAFEISTGSYGTATGYGWGAGTWGRGTWGSAASTPVYLPSREVFFDNFNNDLVFNLRGSNIYYWVFNTGFSNRAVLLSSIAGAVAVPQQVIKTMFAPSGHLLALGCTEYDASNSPTYVGSYDPLLVRWSDVDPNIGPKPEAWQPTTTNTAGFLRLKSGTEIITGLNSKQETLIWTDTSLTTLQFLGTNEVFGTQELSNQISIAGPNVAIQANNAVVWMGKDNFYVYSGRVEVLPCTLSQYIFEDINMDDGDLFFVGTNKEFNEIIWFYASGTSITINRYVVYNYKDNIWYYGQLNRTTWVDRNIFDYPLATNGGWIYQHEDGYDDGQPLGTAALPITSYIQSADIDIDDGEYFTLLKRVIPDVNFSSSTSTTPQVQMTMGVRKFPGAANVTTDVNGNTLERDVTAVTATIDQYTNQVYVRARGRQINYKIASDGLGVAWQLGMPRIDAKPDGRRG